MQFLLIYKVFKHWARKVRFFFELGKFLQVRVRKFHFPKCKKNFLKKIQQLCFPKFKKKLFCQENIRSFFKERHFLGTNFEAKARKHRTFFNLRARKAHFTKFKKNVFEKI